MSELERAEAVAAFLAWPGPGRAGAGLRGGSGTPLRTHVLSALLAALIGCALAACSLAFPLAGAAGQAWGAGSHVLLFCHLTL